MYYKILVTGSRGVVGDKLVTLLRSQGHSVFGIDLMHDLGERGYSQNMSSEEWIYSRCDIGNYRQLARIFDEAGPFDFVYNCAAEFGRWNGEDYYEQLWNTNAIGLKNILRLQEERGFKLIHFSSSEVYGDYIGRMAEDVMDVHEIKQMNDYAMSKWVNEMQIRNSSAQFGTETVVVRLFNTYGPGEYYHPYRSVNCKFCYHALHDLPITVYTGHYRTSTYIDDCVATVARICDRFLPGRVYNIGSQHFHDIETLADIIWSYVGASPSLISFSGSEVLTTTKKDVDVSLSVRELGHKDTVTLTDGVKATIDWMRKHYNR